MPDPLATAVQHHQDGRLQKAEALYRQVLAGEPDNPEALHLLGVLLLHRGDPAVAAELIRRAIGIDSERPGYHFNLGAALAGLGDRAGAIAAYRRALVLRADDAEAEVNLGHLLLADRRPEEAIACFDRALQLHAGHRDALFGRGAAYAAVQRFGPAEQDFRTLLSAHPDHPAALNRLGTVLIKQTRMDEAIEVLRHAQARHPENPDILANLASAHEARNDLDAAEAAARQVLALTPDAPGPLILLARIDHRRGRLVEARHNLEAALTKEPSEERRCDALFELGQVLDRLGEAEAAHSAFLQANALQADSPAARRFDGRRFHARVETNRAAFTPQGLARMLARVPPAPSVSTRAPVFFVGFPRSGTTLVERALAAHPDILTTEERSPLTPAVRRLIGRGGTPEALDGMDEAELEAQLLAARALFWQQAEAVVGPLDGRLLVDKLPLNLVDLGYANLLFPDARVLVALRDPRDACLSCFMQRFRLDDSMINFCRLEQTAETYAAVMGLWLVYRDSLTLPWREFRYEDLVEDFEAEVRGLLGFIGLDWHEAVARYREDSARRSVATPSYRQVTREIYRDSIGRWRAYRDVFAPLQPLLAPFVDAFGYPKD